METTFRLTVGKVAEYRLPPIVDKEENDEPEVYVKPVDGKMIVSDECGNPFIKNPASVGTPLPYPEFMHFENATNTINFRPDNPWDKGKTYWFQLIVKEKNSDVIVYPYCCKVIMLGTKTKEGDKYKG